MFEHSFKLAVSFALHTDQCTVISLNSLHPRQSGNYSTRVHSLSIYSENVTVYELADIIS